MDELGIRSLAYLGDAVWELMIRELTVQVTNNAKDLHKITTDKVNMDFQTLALNEILSLLSDEELEIVRKARNLPVPISRRSNQSPYRQATSFEALIGFWYKNDKARLDSIFTLLNEKYLVKID